jgi:hypothetical protein
VKDRKPRKPGRFLVNTDDGRQYYATLTLADDPEEEGDPLNKNTLLKDSTAALFNLGTTAVPDDALRAIKGLFDASVKMKSGSYVGTGKVGSANPNSLTYGFVPDIVVVQSVIGPAYFSGSKHDDKSGLLVMVRGSEKAKSFGGNDFYGINTVSWSGNSVHWYCTTQGSGSGSSDGQPSGQMNHEGATYYHFAVGHLEVS